MKKAVFQWIYLSVAAITVIAAAVLFFTWFGKPMRVMVTGQFSGKNSDFGQSMFYGISLARDRLDPKAEKYLLIPVDLNKYPDDDALFVAMDAAKADVMVGPDTSSAYLRLKPYIDETKLLTFGVTVSTDQANNLDDTFFRLPLTQRDSVAMTVRAVQETFNWKKVLILRTTANEVYSKTYAETFIQMLEGTGIAQDEMTLDEFGAAVIVKECEGILLIAPAMESGLAVQTIRERFPNTPVLMSAWSKSDLMLEYAGVNLKELYFMSAGIPKNEAVFEMFRSAFKEEYKSDSNIGSYFGYETMHLLDTVQLSANSDRLSMLDAARRIRSFVGQFDTYSINETGDARNTIYLLRYTEKGFEKVAFYE